VSHASEQSLTEKDRVMRRAISIGGVQMGGGAPIVVQSMTNTRTEDVDGTVAQIQRLEQVGCEIVRVAVPNFTAAASLPQILERIAIPLVADIHFDHRLALAAIEAGVNKLRLNPGNITDPKKIEAVTRAALKAGVPIRVGANSGSLGKTFLNTDGHPTADGMVESALQEIRLLETLGFNDIVVSLKGTDVPMTLAAYRRMAAEVDYPLHIGITEAGTPWEGVIRSAVGLGILLEEGLGDTLRVSLAGDPVDEVLAAYEILRSLGLRERGILYRVCPTCGRTAIDLISIAQQVRKALADVSEPLTVALMGCAVNGPGEAREADVALVGGVGVGTIFEGGRPVEKNVPEKRLARDVIRVVRMMVEEKQGKRL
jgi:(E)-4-hydroxy-3-methylbut-2-enyl-diphosphate synthase